MEEKYSLNSFTYITADATISGGLCGGRYANKYHKKGRRALFAADIAKNKKKVIFGLN